MARALVVGRQNGREMRDESGAEVSCVMSPGGGMAWSHVLRGGMLGRDDGKILVFWHSR